MQEDIIKGSNPPSNHFSMVPTSNAVFPRHNSQSKMGQGQVTTKSPKDSTPQDRGMKPVNSFKLLNSRPQSSNLPQHRKSSKTGSSKAQPDYNNLMHQSVTKLNSGGGVPSFQSKKMSDAGYLGHDDRKPGDQTH